MQDPLPTPDFRPPPSHRQRILKLRGDQERRRFFVGVSIDPPWEHVGAALVAATGRGLEARFEIASHVLQPFPPDVAAELKTLEPKSPGPPTSTRLSARLTEAAGAAVDSLSAIEQNVWPASFLCGVQTSIEGLDAALLAEMTQLNIVDGFAARDAVLNGTGQFLDALPLWMLLHHAQLHRLFAQFAPELRLLYLPGSRDERGVANIDAQRVNHPSDLRHCLGRQLKRTNPGSDELLWMAPDGEACELLQSLIEHHPALVVQTPETLGIAAAALPAASAAVLAMLHIDQTPANLPFLTGAMAPRVLGRLTPGSAKSWNRLLRDLAFSRPLITPLRAAV